MERGKEEKYSRKRKREKRSIDTRKNIANGKNGKDRFRERR